MNDNSHSSFNNTVRRVLTATGGSSYLDVNAESNDTLDIARQCRYSYIQGTTQNIKRVGGQIKFADPANLPFFDKWFEVVSLLNGLEEEPTERIPLILEELERVARKRIFLSVHPDSRLSQYEWDSLLCSRWGERLSIEAGVDGDPLWRVDV